MRNARSWLWMLLVTLPATLLGCEGVGSPPTAGEAPDPSGPGTRPRHRPAPRRVDPRTAGGCDALCARHGACLSRFRTLGAPSLFPGDVGTCPGRCRQGAADGVLGPAVVKMLRQCLSLASCDAVYGCGLRLRLVEVRAHPWKRIVLRARRIASTLRSGTDARMLKRCAALPGLRAELQAIDQPAARAILGALDQRCQATLQHHLTTALGQLDEARKALDVKRMTRLCAGRARYAALPGARRSPLRGRLRLLASRCDGLEPLRALALTVRDAERDVAEVARQLERGHLEDAAYHKCVHKAAILRELRTSAHPRAKQVARTLGETCFERFPITWLRRVQRTTPAGSSPAGGCYRVRQVMSLLRGQARAPVRQRNRALLAWVRRRCPG